MEYLDIHTHHRERRGGVRSILSLSLSGGEPFPKEVSGWCSLGLHPWYARREGLEADLNRLIEVSRHLEMKMIGECGLDRMRGASLDDQVFILRKQVELAGHLDKPLILHCVRCFDELIQLKKEMKPEVPMIVHGFNKSAQLGRQLLDQGFYLSFGKAILKKESGPALLLREQDVFFLETDESGHQIEEIYAAAADLKNCSVEDMKAHVFTNWKNINMV